MIAATLAKVPKKYGSVLTSVICNKGHWRIRNNLVHSSNNDDDVSDSDKEKEYALNATTFTGVCYKYGKKGHKAHQCRSSSRSSRNGFRKKNKFTGTCNLCGKCGHKGADCWEDDKNKDKRPKNWKSNMDKAGWQ